jgi:hypothetical protein
VGYGSWVHRLSLECEDKRGEGRGRGAEGEVNEYFEEFLGNDPAARDYLLPHQLHKVRSGHMRDDKEDITRCRQRVCWEVLGGNRCLHRWFLRLKTG